jgi:hypothetical protein
VSDSEVPVTATEYVPGWVFFEEPQPTTPPTIVAQKSNSPRYRIHCFCSLRELNPIQVTRISEKPEPATMNVTGAVRFAACDGSSGGTNPAATVPFVVMVRVEVAGAPFGVTVAGVKLHEA